MEFNPIVIYKNKRNGKIFELHENIFGRLFKWEKDYRGMFLWGATSDFNRTSLDILKHLDELGEIEWIKTPKTNYHVWHICTCDKCSPCVLGTNNTVRSGGKIIDHSQGAWDEHLRYVDNEFIGNFPSIGES